MPTMLQFELFRLDPITDKLQYPTKEMQFSFTSETAMYHTIKPFIWSPPPKKLTKAEKEAFEYLDF